MSHRYNAEIVAGALLPAESRIIARLLLDGVSEQKLKNLITVENVLQKRSPGTALRKTKLIKKRLSLVDESLWRIIAEGERQASVQGMLIAAIKHNKLIGDFLLRVVKEKWRLFETALNPGDWKNFLEECEQIDKTIKEWQDSTRIKLGQVVKRCLVEAGYLESSASPKITPVILIPEIKQYLINNDEDYVLSCMDLVS